MRLASGSDSARRHARLATDQRAAPWLAFPSPPDRAADDRADRRGGVPLSARDDREAGSLEHSKGARIGRSRGHAAARRIDRIGLDESCAVVAGVLDGRVQESPGDPLPPGLPGHDEADHRPDRLVVDPSENLRPFEPRVVLPGADADPTNRPPVSIGDEPGCRVAARAGCDDRSVLRLRPVLPA